MNKTNIRVDIRIMGDSNDINEITEALNISPTNYWRKGDTIRNLSKRRTYTAWIYSTGSEETLNVNTQIKKIEKIFIPKADILYKLKSLYDLEFSLDVIIIIENEEPPAIYLESSIIQFAARLDAKIDIDMYVN